MSLCVCVCVVSGSCLCALEEESWTTKELEDEFEAREEKKDLTRRLSQQLNPIRRGVG